jgi:branched-subunit amino acid transport protein AzlD
MLNIFKNMLNIFNDKSLNTKIQSNMQKLVCIGLSLLTILIAVAFRDVLINNTSVSIVVLEALHSKFVSALLTFNRNTYIYVVTLLYVACIEFIYCTKYTPPSKKYF